MRLRKRAPLRLGLLLVGLLAGTAAVQAEERPAALSDTDRGAIRSVIESQIGAFGRDDGAAAFAFASPAIQQMFGNASMFMEMVRRGYPPVYHPGAIAFGPLVEMDGRTVQRVELAGPDGAHELALYFMEREADGSWRIDGCVLVPSESVGA